MKTRIHIVVGEEEKERYRSLAEKEGRTLSDWLRQAARDRADAREGEPALESREALDAFFRSCDAREVRPESGWEAHRRVIEASIGSGVAPS